MTSNSNVLTVSVDKQQVAKSFSKAADNYDNHAHFQRDVGRELLKRVPDDLTGRRVLDLGCGTGYFSSELKCRGAQVICVDLSSHMLTKAQERCGDNQMSYHLADAELLPFADNSIDYVFSNLALQWCDDLAIPLKEIKRILRKGGKGFFSTLVDGSLNELKIAWSTVDSYQHINHFLSANQVKIALAQSGNFDTTLNFQAMTVWYNTAVSLMKDLKGIGANHVPGRITAAFNKQVLARLEESYQEFKNDDGVLPATYQVCLGVILR
ncbi:malonyl-ACP O-methyltransferase BioC [Vibrio sp. CAIM 722]|uniref:Malonyl-[acyl-carrier protein] O-methyltransferase n=1 Tax=Vibrio eleionomae TaxID=2653505 RepID=A0A7X4RW93_9VIBR|nr:malonyl-ACP O-methyltransferase BioC [Vibrio eleionomae]MZI95107.1 malonyl-ACP O-methyltransferase BioC [Vibrio eleionomae]